MEGIYKKDNSYKNVKKNLSLMSITVGRGGPPFLRDNIHFSYIHEKTYPFIFLKQRNACVGNALFIESEEVKTSGQDKEFEERQSLYLRFVCFLFVLFLFGFVLCCVCVCVCLFCFCCCCLIWKAVLWKTILHVHDWINHWNILVNFSTIIILK